MVIKTSKKSAFPFFLALFWGVLAYPQISFTPNTGERGTSFGVTVTNMNILFATSTTTCVTIFAQPNSLSLTNVNVQNSNSITGTLDIPLTHSAGSYDARVTQGPNCNGTQFDCTNCFTIVNPACLTVTSTSSSGLGSLREAFNCATEGDTIRFAPVLNNSTILLNTPVIANGKELVLYNEANNNVTISTTLTSTLTVISTAKPLSIFGLKFSGNVPNTPLVLKVDPGGSVDFNDCEINLTNIDKN